MNRPERKRKLTGPWRNLQGAVWVIGMVILFTTGRWWPGILVLAAISMVLEVVLVQLVPQAFEQEEQLPSQPPTPPAPVSAPASAPAPAQAAFDNRFEALPSVCPRCGGPVRWQEVKWTGPRSANCSYCGANLPLKKD